MFSCGVLAAVIVMRLASPVSTAPAPVPLAAADDARVSISWLPPTVQKWQGPIEESGRRYGIDPELLAIIMTVESGGYAKAKSEAGAVGLMQVMPPTAQDIARRHLKAPRPSYDLEDPRTNIEFGAAYLDFLRDEFGEARHGPDWDTTVELVAAGYNGGPGTAGALYRGEGLRDIEPVTYSRDVYNMWRERDAPRSPTYERWLERGGASLVKKAKAEQ